MPQAQKIPGLEWVARAHLEEGDKGAEEVGTHIMAGLVQRRWPSAVSWATV